MWIDDGALGRELGEEVMRRAVRRGDGSERMDGRGESGWSFGEDARAFGVGYVNASGWGLRVRKLRTHSSACEGEELTTCEVDVRHSP